MTVPLRFQGYSDDTFACDGPGIDVDCDTCASRKMVVMEVRSGADALFVTGQFAAGPVAGWTIGVGPVEGPDREAQPVPNWPIRIIRGFQPYSVVLVIEAPDHVTVRVVAP